MWLKKCFIVGKLNGKLIVFVFEFLSSMFCGLMQKKNKSVPQGFVVCLGYNVKTLYLAFLYNGITAMCDGE